VAKFKLREDGAALRFKVNVANIDNTVAAHIHCAAVGVNGPVGVTLFMASPAGDVTNGTLAEGTITPPDPGNGCAWANMAAVLPGCRPATPTSTCTPTTGYHRPTPGPGTSPAVRSAARSGRTPKGGVVLGAGCGTGRLAVQIADGRPDVRIHGVEFTVADLANLPLPDRSVDLVVSTPACTTGPTLAQ
jgi:hypothetical protein